MADFVCKSFNRRNKQVRRGGTALSNSFRGLKSISRKSIDYQAQRSTTCVYIDPRLEITSEVDLASKSFDGRNVLNSLGDINSPAVPNSLIHLLLMYLYYEAYGSKPVMNRALFSPLSQEKYA